MARLLGRKGGIFYQTTSTEINAEGWDTLTEELHLLAPNEATARLLGRCVIGRRATQGFMVLTNARCERIRANAWRVVNRFQGMLTTKPFKRRLRTFPDKTRGSIVSNVGGVPVMKEVEVNESLVGVTVYYITNVPPNLARVGSRAFPPGGVVGVPRPMWATLVNPLELIPSGWVLDGIESDELAGTTLNFVQADFVFYQRYRPGSNTSA